MDNFHKILHVVLPSSPKQVARKLTNIFDSENVSKKYRRKAAYISYAPQ
jgi:hypothetical protein